MLMGAASLEPQGPCISRSLSPVLCSLHILISAETPLSEANFPDLCLDPPCPHLSMDRHSAMCPTAWHLSQWHLDG